MCLAEAEGVSRQPRRGDSLRPEIGRGRASYLGAQLTLLRLDDTHPVRGRTGREGGGRRKGGKRQGDRSSGGDLQCRARTLGEEEESPWEEKSERVLSPVCHRRKFRDHRVSRHIRIFPCRAAISSAGCRCLDPRRFQRNMSRLLGSLCRSVLPNNAQHIREYLPIGFRP